MSLSEEYVFCSYRKLKYKYIMDAEHLQNKLTTDYDRIIKAHTLSFKATSSPLHAFLSRDSYNPGQNLFEKDCSSYRQTSRHNAFLSIQCLIYSMPTTFNKKEVGKGQHIT